MKNAKNFNGKKSKKLTLDIYNRTVKFFLFLFQKKLIKNIKYDFFETRDSNDFIIAMKKLGYDYNHIEHLMFGKKPLIIEHINMKPANDAIKEEMEKICNDFYPDKKFDIEFIYSDVNEFLFKYRIYIDSEIYNSETFESKSFDSEIFIDIFKGALDNNEIYLKTNIFKI